MGQQRCLGDVESIYCTFKAFLSLTDRVGNTSSLPSKPFPSFISPVLSVKLLSCSNKTFRVAEDLSTKQPHAMVKDLTGKKLNLSKVNCETAEASFFQHKGEKKNKCRESRQGTCN